MLARLFRHVPLLRLVPGLPPLFDSLLMAVTTLWRPERLRAMHRIETIILSWPGVTTKIHRFGGTQFNLGRHEVGHLHGHGLLDIPFSRTLRDEAVAAGFAAPHLPAVGLGQLLYPLRGRRSERGHTAAP